MTGNLTIDKNAPKIFMADDTLTLGLASEVGGQLINYGTNYLQLGSRNAAYPGSFFRIDVRDAQASEMFNVKYIPPNGTEQTVFKVSRTGDVAATGVLQSTVTTGTAPLAVTSTTAVTNLNADLLDGVHASGFQRQIDEVIVNINSPASSTGTWTEVSASSWGNPRIGTFASRYNDIDGMLQFNIPAGMDTAYISHLTWSSGGYVDVYGVQADAGLVFLRRINTRQSVENSNEGTVNGQDQHDGSTITLAATGLSAFPSIRLQNRLGRFHLTGMSFTSAKLKGAEGTGMVHPAQLSLTGAGSGLNADLLDGLHGSAYLVDDGWNNAPGQDANTQPNMKADFTYANNAPWNGSLISFGSGNYYMQLNSAYSGGGEGFSFRTKNGDNNTWNGWNRIFHDDYHPNADTLTTARTLTIGSTGKTFNGSANVSWTLTEIGAASTSHAHVISDVTNLQSVLDSTAPLNHAHVISDVTGLQDALNAKLNLTGGTLTGLLKVSANTVVGNAFVPTTSNETNKLNIISGSTSDGGINGIKFHENTGGFGMSFGYDGTGSGANNKLAWYTDANAQIMELLNSVSNTSLKINGNIVFNDGYHPNADTLTTARTINGVSFNGSADITITANPNAHTHAIADVTGLQTAIDARIPLTQKGAASGVVPLNASSKIEETYLPNFIFGGMRYIGAIGGNTTAENLLDSAQIYIASNGGTVSGCYFIISGTATITITGGVDTNNGVTHTFSSGPFSMTAEEGDNVFDTIDLEPGDWFVINDTWGPYFSVTYQRWSVVNNTYALVTTSAPGIMSAADKTKLDGIAASANNYTHPTGGANSTISNANGLVLSSITVNTLGHVTAVGSKTLAAADLPSHTHTKANITDFAHTHPYSDLTGTVPTWNQNTTGSAATLTTTRNIALTGDVTGNANFNGSANISITATVIDDSHQHRRIRIQDIRNTSNTPNTIESFSVQSFFNNQTIPTGLNSWYSTLSVKGWDGAYAAWELAGNATTNAEDGLFFRYGVGTSWQAWQRVFTDNYHPNADTLTTARNIALTGAVTGNANFDGSGNISIATTHTADPVITLTGAVTGSGTMTNLGSVSIATTATADPTLTLTGDATGSATFTNLGNATLTVAVADDSHNHIISNVDGLQTSLDAKINVSARGAANGVAPLGADSRVPLANLPAFLTGASKGFQLVSTLGANTTLTTLITSLAGLGGNGYETLYGAMWVATTTLNITWTDQTTLGPVYTYHVLTPGDENDATSPVTLEAGDIIVFTKYSDAAGDGDDEQFTFSIINNNDPRFALIGHTHAIADVTNLQTTLDGKQATITGAATTITGSNLTALRVLGSDISGKVAATSITTSTLAFLDATSSVQTQLSGKASTSHTHGNITSAGAIGSTANLAVVTTTSGVLTTRALNDSFSASALGTSTALVTERDVYYGTPTINNSKSYTSSTSIYAPTSAGTAYQILLSNGGTSAPSWSSPYATTTITSLSQNSLSSTYIVSAYRMATVQLFLTTSNTTCRATIRIDLSDPNQRSTSAGVSRYHRFVWNNGSSTFADNFEIYAASATSIRFRHSAGVAFRYRITWEY
jgi:hypothetical protein